MSNIEDDSILDQQDATLTTTNMEIPNTFGRNLLRRSGLAQGSEAAATGSSSNNKVINHIGYSVMVCHPINM